MCWSNHTRASNANIELDSLGYLYYLSTTYMAKNNLPTDPISFQTEK